MRIIHASVELLTNWQQLLNNCKTIELAGRTCYKTDDKITDNGYDSFIRMLIDKGHESVLEHSIYTFKIVCDRATSHEIVRHRVGMSYSQESQRYCNYGSDRFASKVTIILPHTIRPDSLVCKSESNDTYFKILTSCRNAEIDYLQLIQDGVTPETARSVLPNATKTELILTCNARSLRHFLKLRLPKTAHPSIRFIAEEMYNILQVETPCILHNIETEE